MIFSKEAAAGKFGNPSIIKIRPLSFQIIQTKLKFIEDLSVRPETIKRSNKTWEKCFIIWKGQEDVKTKETKAKVDKGDGITLENLFTALSTEQRLHPLYTQ